MHFSLLYYLIGIAIAFLLVVSAFFTSFFPLKPEYSLVSSIFVVLFALPCYFGLYRSFGKRNALLLILTMSAFALILENIAVITGKPYGGFSYQMFMGETVGKVPWTVGFAWTPIVFGAVAMVSYLLPKKSLLVKIGIVSILMTMLDMVLDPGSVALGFWIWDNPNGFYSVPWSNFAGWLLTSGLAAVCVFTLLRSIKVKANAFSLWTASSYFLILWFWTAVCFFEQLWGAMLIGIVLLVVAGIVFYRLGLRRGRDLPFGY